MLSVLLFRVDIGFPAFQFLKAERTLLQVRLLLGRTVDEASLRHLLWGAGAVLQEGPVLEDGDGWSLRYNCQVVGSVGAPIIVLPQPPARPGRFLKINYLGYFYSLPHSLTVPIWNLTTRHANHLIVFSAALLEHSEVPLTK